MLENETIATPATQGNTNEPAATEVATEAPATGLMGETAEGEEEKAPEGAPESYESFTTPEGYEMSEEQHAAFSAEVKDLGLTQEQAQKLVDFDIKRQEEFVKAQQAQHEATLKDWQTEVRKEYGDKYTEEIAVAGKAYSTFASPKLQALLTESGLNSHPEVIRMFNAIGKAISEDSFVKGGNGTGKERSLQDGFRYVDESYGKG